MNFTFWDSFRYEEHWVESARRVLGGEGALFVASIAEPATSNFIMTWPCYRIGDEVIFQQCVLFLDDIEGVFNPLTPHVYLPQRETVTEEGDRVSEWKTSASALRRFCQFR